MKRYCIQICMLFLLLMSTNIYAFQGRVVCHFPDGTVEQDSGNIDIVLRYTTMIYLETSTEIIRLPVNNCVVHEDKS